MSSATGRGRRADIAREAAIQTALIDHQSYESREAFDADLAGVLESQSPDLVVLAGFMRILTPGFVPAAGRLMNIHPSLLPLYPGLHTHQRALNAGDTHAGATVHYVTGELDGGPPILQAKVAVQPDDDEESLAARVLLVEHQIYPTAINWHLSGRLQLEQGNCIWTTSSSRQPGSNGSHHEPIQNTVGARADRIGADGRGFFDRARKRLITL